MSGLVCVDNAIFDVNNVFLVEPYAGVYRITFSNNCEMKITTLAFKQLQEIITSRKKAEVDRLTKENQFLRGVIAAMPGMGEDYKTAQLEFEHVAEKK